MVSATDVFNTMLEQTLDVFKESQYIQCLNMTGNLMRLAGQFELKDQVVLSEIFGSVSGNSAMLDRHYDLPNNIKKEFELKIISCLNIIISHFKNNNTRPYEEYCNLLYEIANYKITTETKYIKYIKPHEPGD